MIQMPSMPVISREDGVYEAFGKIKGYLMALENSLRYMFSNIGVDNICPGEMAELGAALLKGIVPASEEGETESELVNVPIVIAAEGKDMGSSLEFRVDKEPVAAVSLKKTLSGYLLSVDASGIDVKISSPGEITIDGAEGVTIGSNETAISLKGTATLNGKKLRTY